MTQQQQQFMHTSNGRGNEQDEMLAQIRDQPHYDGHEQYSRGRTAPSAVPDNRSYRPQYDGPHETGSPNVSVVLITVVCLIIWMTTVFYGTCMHSTIPSKSNLT